MTAASATIARHYQESHGDVWVFRDDTRAVLSDKVSALLVERDDVTTAPGVALGMPGGILACFDASGGAPFRDVDLRDLAVRLTMATTDPAGIVLANGTRFGVEKLRALVAVLLRSGVAHARATVVPPGILVMAVPGVATLSLMTAGQGGPIVQRGVEVLDVAPGDFARLELRVAELEQLDARNGSWLIAPRHYQAVAHSDVGIAKHYALMALDGDDALPMTWWALDATGRPCAWPVVDSGESREGEGR